MGTSGIKKARGGQTIRFAPPMNITQADADFLLAVLDEAIGTL
jgi:4-aminobutyrate aminotransferase-like enzyme